MGNGERLAGGLCGAGGVLGGDGAQKGSEACGVVVFGQGVQGLALGRGGDLAADGEVGEEAVDVVGVKLLRVAAGKGEEAADPGEIGLLGADGVVLETDGVPSASSGQART